LYLWYFIGYGNRGRAQSFLTNGLVAYYPFNGNAQDASGNGNNGTIHNLTSTNGNINTANSALYFNGSSGYALIPNNASLNPTNLSLSVWVKPDTGFSSLGMIFSKHENSDNNDGSWWLAAVGQGSIDFWGGNEEVSSSGGVPANVWTHCVFTYSSVANTWNFYINGVPNQTGVINFLLGSTTWPLRIGTELQPDGVSLNNYFKGAMNNLRVYNRVLSSNEVVELQAYDLGSPQFLQNLTNSYVVNGSNFVFNVSVSGPAPLNYQWYFTNGSGGGQAGGYAQTISGLVYNVVVTNGGYGYGNIPPVSFTGGNPTTPAGGVAVVSNGVVTGVTITNAGIGYTSAPAVAFGLPNGYLAGQNTNFLAISNATAANAGTYYVVVTNSNGAVTSSVVSLTILFPPTITNNPTGFQAALHGGGSLMVGVSGTAPFYYQWLLNGTNVSGANSSSYTINNLTLNSAGSYMVLVTNSYGSVTSAPVNVELLPSLTTPFAGAIALWGADTILSVGAVGSGTLSYQWYFNGAAVSGATGTTYEFNSIQFTNAGLYSVVVSSPYGSVTNTAYQVIVNPANVGIGLCPEIYLSGTIGYSYIIQSTTNLSNTNAWVTVTNITLPSASFIWADTATDTTVAGNPRKFYRVLAGQ
jgi:hypothetical protein